MRSAPPLAPVLAALAALSLAAPARVAADPPPDVLDVSAVKDRLLVLTDGKGRHLAVVPFGESVWEHLYWSEDGKDFFQQRVFGGGSSGSESFSRNFWEPRVRRGNGASLDFHDGKYVLSCGERETVFTPVPADRAKPMLDAAAFHPARWKYRAYALARDDSGTYYFVDRRREDGSMEFRLYAGQRGAMKPLRMTNIVSDSEGDIFSTRSGELRLVLDKKQSAWVVKGKRQELRPLPLEDNAALIYSDLGVYTGQRLGTPCDVL